MRCARTTPTHLYIGKYEAMQLCLSRCRTEKRVASGVAVRIGSTEIDRSTLRTTEMFLRPANRGAHRNTIFSHTSRTGAGRGRVTPVSAVSGAAQTSEFCLGRHPTRSGRTPTSARQEMRPDSCNAMAVAERGCGGAGARLDGPQVIFNFAFFLLGGTKFSLFQGVH